MIDTVKPGWLRESLSLELDMRVISNGDSLIIPFQKGDAVPQALQRI